MMGIEGHGGFCLENKALVHVSASVTLKWMDEKLMYFLVPVLTLLIGIPARGSGGCIVLRVAILIKR